MRRISELCFSLFWGMVFIVVMTLLPPPLARGGEKSVITTDRPDFVESAETVGRNRLQIETSFALEHTGNGVELDEYATPTLFRYGFHRNWEARLETPAFMRWTESADSDCGFADISVGVKSHVVDGKPERFIPSVAWLFHMDLPTGSSGFQGQGVRPSIRGVFEWELPA